MEFVRHYWINLLILAAILVAALSINAGSAARDRAQHNNSVAACIRGNEDKAYDINFMLDASAARQADGNSDTADKYQGDAQAKAGTIPTPAGVPRADPRMYAVEYTVIQGKPVAHLTAEARALQAAGCERVNS